MDAIESKGIEFMIYQYLANSVGGFIQQTAVCYVQRGYFFYVIGQLPKDKNIFEIDQKLLNKYQISLSKDQRYRRKKEGLGNVQYIRCENTFLLLANSGKHLFFDEEKTVIQDVRKTPIKVFGYSIKWEKEKVLVSIDEPHFHKLKATMLELALKMDPKKLKLRFRSINFESYSPVYHQIKSIWNAVNLKRKAAGLPPVPISALRNKRRIYRPFKPGKYAQQQLANFLNGVN